MKRFLTLLLTILLVLPTFSMLGCKDVTKGDKVLRVCNCEDYIDEDLLAEFTEETGIEVIYSTYGTNENLYNELVINPNSYDLVVPSEYMIQKLAVEGRLKKLDHSKVPNYEQYLSNYIKGKLESITFEVEDGEYKGQDVNLSEFMVGYMWGTMGWVYNTDYVTVDDVKSWYGPFKNPDNPNLNKKITIKDAVRDSYLVGLAMTYQTELYENAGNSAKITEILNRTDKTAIDKVGEMLTSLKPMLYGFEVDSGKNDIISAYIVFLYVAREHTRVK